MGEEARATEDRNTARPEEVSPEFTLKPRQNSKLNKPVNESQQTVQSQATKSNNWLTQ